MRCATQIYVLLTYLLTLEYKYTTKGCSMQLGTSNLM